MTSIQSSKNVVLLSEVRLAKALKNGLVLDLHSRIMQRLYEAVLKTRWVGEFERVEWVKENACINLYAPCEYAPCEKMGLMFSLQLAGNELEFVISFCSEPDTWTAFTRATDTPFSLAVHLRQHAPSTWAGAMISQLGKITRQVLCRMASAEPGGFLDKDRERHGFPHEFLDCEDSGEHAV